MRMSRTRAVSVDFGGRIFNEPVRDEGWSHEDTKAKIRREKVTELHSNRVTE